MEELGLCGWEGCFGRDAAARAKKLYETVEEAGVAKPTRHRVLLAFVAHAHLALPFRRIISQIGGPACKRDAVSFFSL